MADTDTDINAMLKDKGQHYDTEQGQAWSIIGDVLNFLDSLGLLSRILKSGYSFAWIMILAKLIRIAQDPEHEDSWLDISGYATLALKTCTNRINHG